MEFLRPTTNGQLDNTDGVFAPYNTQDAEHSDLALENSDEDPMDKLPGHSITYRISVG